MLSSIFSAEPATYCETENIYRVTAGKFVPISVSEDFLMMTVPFRSTPVGQISPHLAIRDATVFGSEPGNDPSRCPSAMAEPIAGHGANSFDETADVALLLERVAAGDREAFRVFYERNAARVMAMIQKRISAPELARELVQDVFVAVWLGAAGYRRDLGDAERWLFGITRHKILDHHRRVCRLVAAAAAAHSDRDVAETWISDADRRLSVERALVRLTDEQRRVVGLIYGAGMTFDEAARVLKVPAGTVKSRVNAALTTLRGFFAGSNP